MIVLAVTWMAKDGQDNEMARIFTALEAEARKEPGCLMFVVHRHRTDHRRFFVYEQYKDDAAMETHRGSPHFQKYVVQELPKFGARVEGELFKPLNE